MTNPTTPFSWSMPTASDLVTDLPADFETFGQAVATSMADLLGGTSGQVLSKASNTDMDFTWVTSDDANAIQNAIVDAKGDLIAASAADTPARLAVGNNGETLIADSTASTGLKWAKSPNFVGCLLGKTNTQTLGNATVTSITFNDEFFDTNSFHDNATNNTRITIPAGLGGKYALTATLSYKSNSTGIRLIYFLRNGTVTNSGVEITALNGFDMSISASCIMEVSAGDYLEIAGYQNSGGNLNIDVVTAARTQFSATYLGA